ncbi:MAG: transposase, partial [Acidimicrobiia bacterium]|nr:transposase [Acidimicrobiia bacterium]
MTSPTPKSAPRPSISSPPISKSRGCPKRPIGLGRTLWRWRTEISNWHKPRVTNAATEATNNLAKRLKRVAFGFTN